MKILSSEPTSAKRTMLEVALLGMSMLMAVPVWSQSDNPSRQPVPALVGLDHSSTPAESINSETNDDRVLTPPPVTGQAYPSVLASEERSNYLRAGVSFTSAYTDNALASLQSHPVSDVSYSVAPMIALDQTTPRQQLVLTYAPGFTFYQRTSPLNETDQNAAIEYQYRLSPHVAFSARDSFQKSSNVFNQPDLTSNTVVSGGSQGANFSVISPIADRLSNTGSVGLAYQYRRNDMVGASGTFSYLHYPNPDQVPGLSDASSQAGLAFYSHRLSKAHYIGVTYQCQRLMSYPTGGQNETVTHAPRTSSNVSGYNVYRAAYVTSCQSYAKINSLLNTGTLYTDSTVINGASYCYETTAVNTGNEESGPSNTVSNVQIPSP